MAVYFGDFENAFSQAAYSLNGRYTAPLSPKEFRTFAKMTKTIFRKYVPDRVRYMANVIIVAWLLISPALFVNLAVLQDQNTSCYVVGSEEQNERQPGKEIHAGKTKVFLSEHFNNRFLKKLIKAEIYVQSEVVLNSRFMDEVPTQPPRSARA